jgi:protocatechuate 3,4-dioxygenase beta subunit
VTLDGSASCDADGDALEHRWELVSAPAGSAWRLTSADTARPELLADRAGPYRVRLVVTDEHGIVSAEQEVLVVAGDRCADGIDNDTDGRLDTDDRDCDGVDEGEPPPPDAEIELSGVVTDTDGAAVAGASVWAYDADDQWVGSGWTTTGADGSFAFDHLPPGEYRLVFRAPPGTALVSEWYDDESSRAAATPIVVEAGDEVGGLDAVLAIGAAVSGVVTDEDGLPLAGVQVWAYDADDTWVGSALAVTGDDGSYLLEGLATTTYRVRFVAPAGAARRAEWYDDVTSRAAATWVEALAGQLRTGIDAALTLTG